MGNKSLIIAERIRLKYGTDITVLVILSGVFVALLICFRDIEELIIPFSICLVGIVILFSIDIYSIYRHNNKPSTLITYRDGTFNVYDKSDVWKLKKSDIVDMTYKNKISYFFSPHFIQTTKWNYGKLILYVKTDEDSNHCYKIKLNHVANPDIVFEKIAHILKWDMIED